MHLSTFPFMTQLEPEAFTFLQQHIKPVTFTKNTLLFYQGDVCDTILWLTEGEVRLYVQSDTIEEVTLYTLKEGEQCIVNTASLLSQTNAVASALTLTDIKGYIINAVNVKKLSRMSEVYHDYLFSLYQLRFKELTALLNDIKFKRLDARIMEWLNKQNQPLIYITHGALADILGSSRVVISRILKEMEQKKLLILHRGKIELLTH